MPTVDLQKSEHDGQQSIRPPKVVCRVLLLAVVLQLLRATSATALPANDLLVWRPSTGTWISAPLDSAGTILSKQWGIGTSSVPDKPLTGDLDGDGKADLIVFRDSDHSWRWLKSGTQYSSGASGNSTFGASGDIPFIADMDHDGKCDLVVWRPANGTWYWTTSGTSYTDGGNAANEKQWGNAGYGDIPLIGDLDADGSPDLFVWRPIADPYNPGGTWYWLYYLTSSSGYDYTAMGSKQWGNASFGDIPMVGDLDGDSRSDLVVWRASTGTWYWLTAASGYNYAAAQGFQWGNASLGDKPFLGDIDGDGKHDLLVWRTSEARWYWLTSSSDYVSYGSLVMGAATDTPITPAIQIRRISQPAAPTFSIAAGTYSSNQTLILSTTTSGVEILYNLDGTAPASSATVASAPITLSAPTWLRAVSHVPGYEQGNATSTIVAADYAFAVATPILSPTPRTTLDGQPIIVTITDGTPGAGTPPATLEWTDNLSDPMPTWHAYTGPLTVPFGGSQTIHARARRNLWSDSSITGGHFESTLRGPVAISTNVSPLPNQAGWNNTDTTVSFTCTNATVCPVAVVISAETDGQVVTGTASNGDHSASVSVTIRLDKTPPSLTLSPPPSTAPAGGVSISATVSDALSGLSESACNGAPTTVVAGAFSCNIVAHYGMNSYVIGASDIAENDTSIGGTIAGTGAASFLSISPSRRTMSVGETLSIKVLDDGGFAPSVIAWSVADASVATIVNGVLTAIGIGTTTVTASSGNLSADSTVTVVSGGLPSGTVRWGKQVTANGFDTVAVRSVLASDERTTLAQIESFWDESVGEFGGISRTKVSGLSPDGATTFVLNAGLDTGEAPRKILGDVGGGVLMLVTKQPITQSQYDYDTQHGGSPVTLVKIGLHQADGSNWRVPLGRDDDSSLSILAQGEDGAVWGLRNRYTELFALDPRSGTRKFVLSAPPSVTHYRSDSCPQLNYDVSAASFSSVAALSGLVIDREGRANVIARQTEQVVGLQVSGDGNCIVVGLSPAVITATTMSLFRVSVDGASERLELGTYTTTGIVQQTGQAGGVLPDDSGGVLASWLVCSRPSLTQEVCEFRGRHVDPTSMGLEYAMPNGVPSLSGIGKIAYDAFGAVDMVTGSRLWSKAGSSGPVAVLENGFIAFSQVGGTSSLYDSTGALVESGQPTLLDLTGSGLSLAPTLIEGRLRFGWRSTFDEFVATVSSPAYVEPNAGFGVAQGGGFRNANAPQVCRPTYNYFSVVLSSPRDYRIAIDDEVSGFPSAGSQGTFSADEKSLVLPAFRLWQFDGDRGFPKAINWWTLVSDPPANLVLKKADLSGFNSEMFRTNGLALYPIALYPSFGGDPYSDRKTAQEPNFPADRFGVLTRFDLAPGTVSQTSYFKYILAHEFGHAIGLAHAENGCSASTSMMTRTADEFDHPAAPTEADKTALRRLLRIF